LVYPNPAKDNVTVNFQKVIDQATIEVTNVRGQPLTSERYNNIKEIELQLGVKSGLYFVRIKMGDSEIVKSVLKL